MDETSHTASPDGAHAAVVLRDARDDERDAVRELTLRAYAEYATIMTPEAWAGLDGAVRTALDAWAPADRIVAEHEGRLVGCVALYPASVAAYGALAGAVPHPELRMLAVLPEARGLGVGQMLVDECVRRARRMGAAELGLHTSRSMTAAIRMYERMGFERAPEHDFQPPGGELVTAYRLRLSGAAPS